RRSTRSNRWRSTAERPTVQFGESVRLGGGGAWPWWDRPTSDVGAPPAPTRNGPATFEDARRKEPRNAAEWLPPWKRNFALRRRTGTGQCPVVAASTGSGSHPAFPSRQLVE